MVKFTEMNRYAPPFANNTDDVLSLEIIIDIVPAVSSETAGQVAATATTVAAAETTTQVTAAETTVEVAASETKPIPKASTVLGTLLVTEWNKQLTSAKVNPDGSCMLEVELPIDESYELKDPKDFPSASSSFLSQCAPDSKQNFKPAIALMSKKIIQVIVGNFKNDNPTLASTHTCAFSVEGNRAKLLLRERPKATAASGGGAAESEDLVLRQKNPFPSDKDIDAAKEKAKPHKLGLSRSKVWTVVGSLDKATRFFKSKNLKIVETKDQPTDTRLKRVRVFFEERQGSAGGTAKKREAAAGGGSADTEAGSIGGGGEAGSIGGGGEAGSIGGGKVVAGDEES